MTQPREGAACAVLLWVATSLHAAERLVTVTTPDGVRDVTAAVACADPVSPSFAVDPRNRAVLPEGCRRVRCASARWLPGATAVGPSGPVTCVLRPAIELAVDLPQDAGGALVVSVQAPGAKTPVFQAVSTPAPPSPRPRLVSPPLAPGRYELSMGRIDGSWTCRTAMRFANPERVSVFVPWRDALIVDGRVTSAEGRALAGVPVAAFIEGAPAAFTGLPPPRGQVENWRCGAPTAEIRSGPDGAFRIAVDPRLETLVVAGGWNDPRGIDFVARRGPRAEPLRLVPMVPHRAAARVLDDDDRPVTCRARVMVDSADERWAARVVPAGPKEAACAPDGRLDVGPIRADAFQIDLRPDDALPLLVPCKVPSGVATKDLGVIRVERGESLRVSVSDERRAPVAAAAVTVTSRGGFVMERSGRTGADGVASISGLPPDAPVDVDVAAAGYGRVRLERASPGGDVAVSLARAGVVQGRVTAADGSPVRASIHAARADGSPLGETEADDAGSFSFTTLPEGVVLLRAVAQGFKPSETLRLTPASSGESRSVVLVLRESARLRGTVFGPRHAPFSGATVLLAPRGLLFDPPEATAAASTRSAHDGGFVLDGTEATDEQVVALADGYAPAIERRATLADGSPIELVLKPEARLLVRLPRSYPSDEAILVADASGVTRAIPVRSPHEIRIAGLAAGRCSLQLRTGQHATAQLIAGETVAVDLSAGARVIGHVTSQGRPRARAAVTIATVGPGSIGTGVGVLTDAGGAFAMNGVAPGEYVLVAAAGDGRAEKRIVVPDDGDLEADLELVPRALRVAVRERGAAAPVEGAVVTVTPRGAACTAFASAGEVEDGAGWDVSLSNGGCARGRSAADGVASMVLGNSGPHAVSIAAAGFAPWTGVVQIVDGTTELVAELTRGGPPIVRVRIETDPPGVAGSIYCVQQGRSGSHGPVAGEATCEGLTQGPADVAFRAADFGVARATVDVPQSGEVAVTLAVPRGGQLIVPLDTRATSDIRVLDERGAAWNRPYGLGWPRCELEERDGIGPAYVCHEMPPGAYAVEVGGRRRSAVVVRGGEVSIAY